jgi:hypothetical protein
LNFTPSQVISSLPNDPLQGMQRTSGFMFVLFTDSGFPRAFNVSLRSILRILPLGFAVVSGAWKSLVCLLGVETVHCVDGGL